MQTIKNVNSLEIIGFDLRLVAQKITDYIMMAREINAQVLSGYRIHLADISLTRLELFSELLRSVARRIDERPGCEFCFDQPMEDVLEHLTEMVNLSPESNKDVEALIKILNSQE